MNEKQPDYCYDPDDWEYTCAWDDRNEFFEDQHLWEIESPRRFKTLIEGPDKWAVSVPISWDGEGEDCEPDDWEIQWFDSEAEAQAAIAKAEARAEQPS